MDFSTFPLTRQGRRSLSLSDEPFHNNGSFDSTVGSDAAEAIVRAGGDVQGTSEDTDTFKRLPHKELRVAEAALESTAARFTAEDWSRMAKALELPEGEMLFQVVKGLGERPARKDHRALP